MPGVNALSEHPSPAPKRTYRKAKRAQDEGRTRDRIVDAAEYLHGSLGPAHTTVSAVADRAGVTRATVYRHFADEESLFLACSQQWISRQQLPDPDAWGVIEDPIERLSAGLVDIYGFYRRGQQMIRNIHRDVDVRAGTGRGGPTLTRAAMAGHSPGPPARPPPQDGAGCRRARHDLHDMAVALRCTGPVRPVRR